MNYKKIIFILVVGSIVFSTNLIASQSFDFLLKIEETNNVGKVLYVKNQEISSKNGIIENTVKYNNILNLIVSEIKTAEKRYNSKELFIVKTIRDSLGNSWTISITVTNKDESTTHFISQQKDKIINGWINRNNKGIFGLRIFNF